MATNTKTATRPPKKAPSVTKTVTEEPVSETTIKVESSAATASTARKTTVVKKGAGKAEPAPVAIPEHTEEQAERPLAARSPKAESAKAVSAIPKSVEAKVKEKPAAVPEKKVEKKVPSIKNETKPVVIEESAPPEVTISPKRAPAKKKPEAREEMPIKPVRKAEPKVQAPVVATPIRREALKPLPPKVTVAPRPAFTPAAKAIDKKPGIIIAHRKLENKAKVAAEVIINTVTEYTPDTYRSILDEPKAAPGTGFRYSDEDLAEFKELISSRIEAARKELNYLQGLITRKDEAGTEDTENRYMNMEDGSGAMEREQLAQMASRQIQFMGHLEKALVRIENKTYGICRVTGKLIDKARLRAVPHATLSIEAKKMMSSKQN